MPAAEPDLELLELRRFITMAEALSFRRASEALGITQPALSRAINALERKIGARLFERTTRTVALTAAGTVLLEQARFVMDAAAAAARRARRAGARRTQLVVAVKANSGTGLLRKLVGRYEREAGTRVQVLVGGWGEQPEQLADGRADVAFMRGPIRTPGLDAEPLFSEPRVAAMAADHPLAKRKSVRRAELANEPVPVWPHTDPVLAAFRAAVDGAGHRFEVPSGPPVHDTGQLLEAVALGQGVAFVGASMARAYPRADIAYVPVKDISESTVFVAWAETCRSREVTRFVRLAVELAREARHEATALA